MENTLMTKLLDGQEKMIEKLATVSEIVRRHDVETFPELKESIKEISHATTRMESKQNEDMERFIQEKNRLYTEFKESKEDHNRRLNLLEEDKKIKDSNKKEVQTHFKGLLWSSVDKVIYVIIGGGATLLVAIKSKLFH